MRRRDVLGVALFLAAVGPWVVAAMAGPVATDERIPVDVRRTTLIVRDITERRLNQDKLRQSEELFSKAFNFSPVMMAITRRLVVARSA